MNVWTIGHSTQPIEPFVGALQAHAIALVADVRRFPASRRHPQFNQAALATALRASGIEYQHLPELGGRRAPRKDSRNTAWQNASFRGYADHMESPEFEAGIARLLDTAAHRRV